MPSPRSPRSDPEARWTGSESRGTGGSAAACGTQMSAVEGIPLQPPGGSCGHASGAVGGSGALRLRLRVAPGWVAVALARDCVRARRAQSRAASIGAGPQSQSAANILGRQELLLLDLTGGEAAVPLLYSLEETGILGKNALDLFVDGISIWVDGHLARRTPLSRPLTAGPEQHFGAHTGGQRDDRCPHDFPHATWVHHVEHGVRDPPHHGQPESRVAGSALRGPRDLVAHAITLPPRPRGRGGDQPGGRQAHSNGSPTSQQHRAPFHRRLPWLAPSGGLAVLAVSATMAAAHPVGVFAYYPFDAY